MIEIQIDSTEITAVMQELFPREYTICIQKIHISKLEAMIGEKGVDPVDDDSTGRLQSHDSP